MRFMPASPAKRPCFRLSFLLSVVRACGNAAAKSLTGIHFAISIRQFRGAASLATCAPSLVMKEIRR